MTTFINESFPMRLYVNAKETKRSFFLSFILVVYRKTRVQVTVNRHSCKHATQGWLNLLARLSHSNFLLVKRSFQ